MGGLSWAMLRKHLPGYLGAFSAMVLAAALMGGSVALAIAAAELDGVDVASFSPERQSELRLWASLMSAMGGLTAVIAIVVSVVLVASMVSFVVAGRRRELALLRLSGARPGQVVRMVTGEVALLSLVAGVLGSLFAQPIGAAYLAIFSGTYGKPDGLHVAWRIVPMLAALALTVVVAVLSALGPARRIGRVQPIEALQEGSTRRRPMTLARWIVGSVALAGALAMLAIPASIEPSAFFMLILLQGLLALLGLVQLAPVIVAPISRLICGLLARVAPGPGTLAQGHASWNAARTASLANPALLLVAVPAVFFVSSFGLTEGDSARSLSVLHADAVVAQGAGTVAVSPDVLTSVPGVRAAAPSFITTGDFWSEVDGALTSYQLQAVDLPRMATMIDLRILEGDLAAVRGDAIAISPNNPARVGDVVSLRGPAGRTVNARIVARVGSMSGGREILVDKATFDLQGVGAEYRTWYLDLADGATADSVAAGVAAALAPTSSAEVTVYTAEGFVKQLAADSNAQVLTSMLVALGGSCLLAALAIGVSVVTSLRERHAEFALSRRAGAQPGAVLGATLIETVAVLAVAFLLAGGVIGLVWSRVWQSFVVQGLDFLPPIPWGLLGAFAGTGVVIALAATVLGTHWALRSIRMA